MAAQKVVISKDLKADLQAFFASMSYDKLFILTDTNKIGRASCRERV